MRHLAAFLLSFCLISSTSAATLDGVDAPDTANVANTPLVLNGLGLRTKFFFDIYVGGLYLPQKSADAEALIKGNDPDRILMHMLYAVSKDQFSDAWYDGFLANNKDSYAALHDQIEQFVSWFADSKKGDVIIMDYTPGTGTQVTWNGEVRGTIPGEAFHHAFLAVFLGPKPPTDSLKDGMLGKS